MTSGSKRQFKIDLTHCQIKNETLNILKSLRYNSKEPMWSVLDRLVLDKEQLLYWIQYWKDEATNRQKILDARIQTQLIPK